MSLFDHVFIASDPVDAARILGEREITHLLCDFDLGVGEGPGGVTGFTFVELWRRKFRGIERAVIFTGSDISRLKRPAEVDAVVAKAEGIGAVIAALTKGDD